MKYFIISLILLLSELGSSAQFTYFNNTYGEYGDQETELITNVEVIGDTIYLFGGIDNDQDPFSFLLRAIDLDGNLLIENTIPVNNSETLIGQGYAISSINQTGFSYTQATIINDELLGFAAVYDLNLDTIWMKTYDMYSPSTYFRANWSLGDGILISGNHDPGNQWGTFLMKIDYEGNLIWNKILREANGKIYYNHTMVELNTGYLLGGSRTDGIFNAMLTKTDLAGNIEWEYYADNFEDDEGEQADTRAYRLAQLPNGDIVGAHLVWYEYAGSNPWPNQSSDYWMSLRINKINVEDNSLYWEHDYFMNYELRQSNLWKILSTDDGGILAMGQHLGFGYTWLLKVDSMGNEEWFKTYEPENINTIRYTPFDIEQTSDGGFVIAGQHRDWEIEGFTQSWVMKIDACGDTEWQGCDYVGIQESIQSKQFKIYPNPASQEIQLEGELLTSGDKIKVFDLYGRLVLQETWNPFVVINISTLATGMYQLSITDDEGTVIGQKLLVE